MSEFDAFFAGLTCTGSRIATTVYVYDEKLYESKPVTSDTGKPQRWYIQERNGKIIYATRHDNQRGIEEWVY